MYLTEEEILKLLDWDKTYEAVEVAFRRVSENNVDQPARTVTIINENRRLFSMPGYVNDEKYGALACKMVASFSDNHLVGIPSISATINLFDERTGTIKAVLSGTEITNWRTAASSVVATKHLFLNRKEENKCKVLAILGCGTQGKIHAEAFKHFFSFNKVRLWNRTSERGRNLVQELNKKYHTNIFEFTETIIDCLKDADVIVTATYASEPIVKLAWIKPGAHINAVGVGMKSAHSELEEDLYRNSSIYVDYWNGARDSLSGLEKLGAKIRGEVGAVITGDLQVTEEPLDRITVFQSLGMAAEDCVMARLIFDSYMEKNKLC